MVNRTHAGVFNADTGGGAQAITWTGNDFTPNFVLFTTQGDAVDVVQNTTSGQKFSHGWGADVLGTKKVWSVALAGEEDDPAIDNSRFCSKTKLLRIVDDIGANVGECTLTSFGNKTININWSTTPSAATRIYYQAIEAENVDIAFNTANTAATSQDVDHAAFTGNAMMVMGTRQTNLDTEEGDIYYFHGMATGAAEERVISVTGDNGTGSMVEDRGFSSTACIRGMVMNGGGDEYLADFTSFGNSKITLNWSNGAASAWELGYVIFNFDSAKVAHEFNPSTSTTEDTITGLGFQGNGMITMSIQTSSSTVGDASAQVGAADSESPENNIGAGFYSENGDPQGDYGIFQSNTDCVNMVFSDGTTRADGRVVAWDSGASTQDVSMTWSGVNGSRPFAYLVFDATTASGGGPAANTVRSFVPAVIG